jgi:alpha-D-ribose 1-methylphosphonate 5-triphosphate synthase subunit PhnG
MTQTSKGESNDSSAARRATVGVMALATDTELAAAIATCGDITKVIDLKSPETGLVMLRGRIGGDGAPFNVGEATVTRAVVRLSDGTIGYSYRLGRDKTAARHAAILDAFWQITDHRERIERQVLTPIRQRIAAENARASGEAAASRVEFFTLARERT